MKKTILIFLYLVMACAICSGAGLLKNQSFEAEELAGWSMRGQGWTIDKQRYSEGASSILCTVNKGDKPELRACVQKIKGVAANKIVEVSVDVSGVNVARTPNSKACLAVLCFDAKGQVLKEYRSNVIKPTSVFQTIEIDDAIVLAGTEQIYIMLVVEIYQPATDGDWWRFDNVKLMVH